MSVEEKPVEKKEETTNDAPKVVNSEVVKAPDLNDKPTAKDAGRFFVMMLTLFLSVVCTILFASSIFGDHDGFSVFFGALLAFIPLSLSVVFSLPSIIIGMKHKNEKDTYKLLMILGIIALTAAVVVSLIAIMNGALLFKK